MEECTTTCITHKRKQVFDTAKSCSVVFQNSVGAYRVADPRLESLRFLTAKIQKNQKFPSPCSSY